VVFNVLLRARFPWSILAKPAFLPDKLASSRKARKMSSNDELKNMLLAFRVSELQMLLGFAGQNKTGRKTELQARAIELLKNKSVPHLSQVHAKIRELYKSIQQSTVMGGVVDMPVSSANMMATPAPGIPRGTIAAPAAIPSHTGFMPLSNRINSCGSMFAYQSKMPIVSRQPSVIPPYSYQPDVRFKKLPFYDILGEILKPSSLNTQRGQEAHFVFYLTPQQTNEVSMNRDIRPGAKNEYIVQVLLRIAVLDTTCEQEDMFPPGLVIKVNNKIVNLPAPFPPSKVGADAKRPPKPVNITSLVKLCPTVPNNIYVSFTPEFGRGYVMNVNVVKRLTPQDLINRLKDKGPRHADYTRGIIKEKLTEDADTEIATTSLRVSLLCPLGKMRMSTPVKGGACTHLQCFDAGIYVLMNEKKPTWTCPVCDKPATYDSLILDGYFQEVLTSSDLPSECQEVQLHQDGSWSSHIAKKEKPRDLSPLPSNVPSTPTKSETIEEILDDSDDGGSTTVTSTVSAPKEPQKDIVIVDLTESDGEDQPIQHPLINNSVSVVAKADHSLSGTLAEMVSKMLDPNCKELEC